MADLIVDSSVLTSPRKLQEMALPMDGHDVTKASGISMKQYEEQLNSLRKENFHLKLRIYFLEEKLGTGSPPAVQGLLEHNVRLQVEVEELRRQLSDKQELLAFAAEAIDVLEHQGSMSADSVEMSINNSVAHKKEINTSKVEVDKKEEATDDTCAESESAGDYLGVTVNNEDLDELIKLRRDNQKALQMIKVCTKKIQQQDKEIKKIKLDKELAYAQVSDNQLEKYAEILKCKDIHIKDLENKVRDLQKNMENAQSLETPGNLQQLLSRRLQGLAYFLDKLLSHKCVLGEDKKKLAESILEQSLALPVGLELDESMAPEELTMDESHLDFDISHSLRIEDLTAMFGHHVSCGEERRGSRRGANPYPRADLASESECWSEPDRGVSMARVGLCDTGVLAAHAHASAPSPAPAEKQRARRARLSHDSRADEELAQLTERCERLHAEKKDLTEKLEYTVKEIELLSTENRSLRASLDSERSAILEAHKNLETTREAVAKLESRVRELEQSAAESAREVEVVKSERRELEETFEERERMLRRAADEAAVTASQAALERARAHRDRLALQAELDDARDKLAAALETNSRLEIEATRKLAEVADNKIAVLFDGVPSEEDRATSPDLGIDSDRLSSLERPDDATLSPRSLYQENVTLKQKLARTKATLAETLTQLNAANMRKRSVQRAICREIHKTHDVLRKARDQFENPN